MIAHQPKLTDRARENILTDFLNPALTLPEVADRNATPLDELVEWLASDEVSRTMNSIEAISRRRADAFLLRATLAAIQACERILLDPAAGPALHQKAAAIVLRFAASSDRARNKREPTTPADPSHAKPHAPHAAPPRPTPRPGPPDQTPAALPLQENRPPQPQPQPNSVPPLSHSRWESATDRKNTTPARHFSLPTTAKAVLSRAGAG